MRFTEEKLEKAFTEFLGQEGFPHSYRITISRLPEEVLIEEDLQNFLLSQYPREGITRRGQIDYSSTQLTLGFGSVRKPLSNRTRSKFFETTH